jgi:hypothetical protein
MLRIMLLSAMLVASPLSHQEADMRSSSPVPGTMSGTTPEGQEFAAPDPTRQGTEDRMQAAQGPIPEAVSVIGSPAPVPPTESPASAQGRRTLSTAFVMIGPDGHLTVQLRSGRVLVLRNVVMRPKDYCGVHVLGPRGTQYCGGYADVAAARPGGAPASAWADPVGPGSKLTSTK